MIIEMTDEQYDRTMRSLPVHAFPSDSEWGTDHLGIDCACGPRLSWGTAEPGRRFILVSHNDTRVTTDA